MSSFHFNEQVLERSYEVPVVVDYWAPWCGPCRTLGPVIEAVADEANGNWELVKVDIDEHPDLAAQEKVRGIPAVKMYHRGKKIAEFMGSLPKQRILQWIKDFMPDERTNQFLEIQIKLEVNYTAGLFDLEDFVARNPDLLDAHLFLAKEIILQQPERAMQLVSDIKIGHDLYDFAEDIRTLAKLMTLPLTENTEVSRKLQSARLAAAENDIDLALQYLIEAVTIDKNYQKDLPRRASIAFFHLLGNEHELTVKHRKTFDRVLY
ncbi:MAG: tetratricopeptide repeat protein [Chitinophagales bacterium]